MLCSDMNRYKEINRTVMVYMLTVIISSLAACYRMEDDWKETSEIPATEISVTTSEHNAVTEETSIQNQSEETTKDNSYLHQVYKEALLDLYTDLIWPMPVYPGYSDERIVEFLEGYEVTDNYFAIIDIDNDGTDELIIDWLTTSVAGWKCEVLEYDESTDEWISEVRVHPYDTAYYDNGIILSNNYHNQNCGNTVWPYFIYIYDPYKDSYYSDDEYYDNYGFVCCYDLEFFALRGLDIPDWFTETDAENAGVVYQIRYEGYDPESYYSQSEYDAFWYELVGQANRIDVPFVSFTLDNINEIE